MDLYGPIEDLKCRSGQVNIAELGVMHVTERNIQISPKGMDVVGKYI